MKEKTLDTKMIQVLVGSRAHGTALNDSDWDYRGVYMSSAYDILSILPKYKESKHVEGKEDVVEWELKHFLKLALKCNPTILEVFSAPAVLTTEYTDDLLALFPHIWSVEAVLESHLGYCKTQKTKFLNSNLNNPDKFGASWYRVLIQAITLLQSGYYIVDFSNTEHKSIILDIKQGRIEHFEVYKLCQNLELKLKVLASSCKKEASYDKINEYLIDCRKKSLELQ